MGHFYHRILFSYSEKNSEYQIMPFYTSYDMFTISHPTAASCHSQHALNNIWQKPNLPFTLRALVTRKTPIWCLQGGLASVHRGRRRPTGPKPILGCRDRLGESTRQRCPIYEPRGLHLCPFCINHRITWDLKNIS